MSIKQKLRNQKTILLNRNVQLPENCIFTIYSFHGYTFILHKINASKKQLKHFLNLQSHQQHLYHNQKKKYLLVDYNGYITLLYDEHWLFAYVRDKNEELYEFKVTFLHPHGLLHFHSLKFRYTKSPSILNVLCSIDDTSWKNLCFITKSHFETKHYSKKFYNNKSQKEHVLICAIHLEFYFISQFCM